MQFEYIQLKKGVFPEIHFGLLICCFDFGELICIEIVGECQCYMRKFKFSFHFHDDRH